MRLHVLLSATALSASALSVAGCGSSESSASSADSELSADHVTTTEWNIIDAENQRDASGPALAQALASTDAATVNRALLALGRIGGADLVPVIAAHFASPTASVRAQAAFALSLLAGDSTRPALIPVVEQTLTPRFGIEKDPAARAALYIALGHVGTAADLSYFEAGLAGKTAETDEAALVGAAQGAAVFFQAQTGAGAAIAPSASLWTTLFTLASATSAADQSAAGARALSSFPGGVEANVTPLSTLAYQRYAAGDKASARWLAIAIANIASPTSLTALTKILTDGTMSASIRSSVAAALAHQGSSAPALALLKTALADPSAVTQIAALSSVSSLGADAASLSSTVAGLVTSQATQNPAVASAALTALTSLDPTTAAPLVTAALAGPSSPWRDAAMYDAAFVAPSALLPIAQGTTNVHDWTNALNAMTYLNADQFTAAYGATSINDTLVPLFTKALALHDEFALQVVGWSLPQFGLTSMIPALVATYPYFTDQVYMEGRNSMVYAIDQLQAKDQVAFLQTLLHDPSRSTAVAAAGALLDLTGTDVSAQASAQSAPTLVTPSIAQINTATHGHVVLETPRGTIVLAMLSSAPLAATQFSKAASEGMYDGLPFHRVIPNFVAQGGDPHKDGYGHFSYVLRDEPGPGGHQLGYVGLATTGKDTGSSQYFIDTGDNYWLDTSFASFAVVSTGLDAAFALQQDDVVTKAYVQ